MNCDNLTKRNYLSRLLQYFRRERHLRIDHVDLDSPGEPEYDGDYIRSLVIDIRTETGWIVFPIRKD